MGRHFGNRSGRREQPGPRRTGLLAAVLAVVALAAAACGGGTSTSGAGQTAYQKDVAWAQCVRAHGVPGFPDPNSQGKFLFNGLVTPKAIKACKHLIPNGGVATTAQLKHETAQALKFVACMRTHGVPSMPDPTIQNGAPVIQGWDPNSPVFQSAENACKRFFPSF